MKSHSGMNVALVMVLCLAFTQQFFFSPKNIHSVATYNITESRKYASFAAVAFCPQQCVEQWKCGTTAKYTLTNVTYITNSITKAVCYVGYEPSTQNIYISWRGSNNYQNWIQDFNFQMQPFEKCKSCFIHVGFYKDFQLNQKKLNEAVSAIIAAYPVKQIINTGHSLGAALSMITGLQMALKYPSITVHVHNFGSPRLGNQNLAQFIESKVAEVRRIVHHKDIVPHLPPEVEYKHPAYQIFFDADMIEYQICNNSGQDKSCSNQYFPNYDPNDHDFYFEHISAVRCC